MNRGGGDLSGNVGGGNYNMPRENFNTYGLSTSFLANLGIEGPLHTKIFVANVSTLFTTFFFLFVFMLLSG